jgi:hypothetical protein
MVSEASLRLAVRNVAYWGDTDVLPFPLENHWFHDAEDAVVALLSDLDKSFNNRLNDYSIVYYRGLSNVGYLGYRASTQIDPIWNAYLLALAIELGPDVEAARIPVDRERVFSYRFMPDLERHTLFDPSVGWHSYQEAALERAAAGGFVLSTDISNFYPRVYHHRIENSLNAATNNNDAVRRVMEVLKRLNPASVSYGLPIGGNAARIIAEALLDRSDRLLLSRGVDFCRFVDDYVIFAQSEEQARQGLVYLSQVLLDHEGLSLSRQKTRLMTTAEFIGFSPAARPANADSEEEESARHFLKIRLKFDPYSPTADEDYERLAEELRRFDIVGMLARELRKSRIDEALTKQLVKSLKYLESDVLDSAVDSLFMNLHSLFPVFPTVAIVVKQVLDDLGEPVQKRVFATLRSLIQAETHVLQVPSNLAFAVRLLAHDPSEESEVILSRVYDNSSNMMIRRDIVVAMAARGSAHWIADRMRDWTGLSAWERRAILPGTYLLGDEGSHWRRNRRPELNQVDSAFLQWLGEKNNGALWKIPL